MSKCNHPDNENEYIMIKKAFWKTHWGLPMSFDAFVFLQSNP